MQQSSNRSTKILLGRTIDVNLCSGAWYIYSIMPDRCGVAIYTEPMHTNGKRLSDAMRSHVRYLGPAQARLEVTLVRSMDMADVATGNRYPYGAKAVSWDQGKLRTQRLLEKYRLVWGQPQARIRRKRCAIDAPRQEGQ